MMKKPSLCSWMLQRRKGCMMRREPEIKHSHMQEQIIMRNTLRKTMRDMRESKMKNTRSSPI